MKKFYNVTYKDGAICEVCADNKQDAAKLVRPYLETEGTVDEKDLTIIETNKIAQEQNTPFITYLTPQKNMEPMRDICFKRMLYLVYVTNQIQALVWAETDKDAVRIAKGRALMDGIYTEADVTKQLIVDRVADVVTDAEELLGSNVIGWNYNPVRKAS